MSISDWIAVVILLGLALLFTAAVFEYLVERIEQRWLRSRDLQISDALGVVILVISFGAVVLLVAVAADLGGS